MTYSIVERAKCAVWYEWLKSNVAVQRKFRAEFSKDAPHIHSIQKWHKALLETGSVLDKEREKKPSVCTEENVQKVQQHFEESPSTSTRQAARELQISRRSVQRILHDFSWHPYKLQIVQQLYEEDKENRVEFARDELQRITSNPNHIHFLAFSDEAQFHLNSAVNRHNCRYWAKENPRWKREESLHSPCTTAWAAIWEHGVIGPYFIDGNITSVEYLNMLNTKFWPEVQRRHLQNKLLFMQDGAPPHWGLQVRYWLNQHFPQRWMGRGSANMPWPPRSPDITPCDFFLWGFVKSKVFTTPIADIPELKERIQQAFTLITRDMLCNVIKAYENRLHEIIENDGSHIEVPW